MAFHFNVTDSWPGVAPPRSVEVDPRRDRRRHERAGRPG